MTERIEQIRNLLTSSPEDVFLHYSLAMELTKAEQWDQAIAAFDECIALDKTYLAARVEKGKALRSAGRLNDARATFTTALAAAQTANDHHVADNIRMQLDAMGQ